LAGLRLVDPQDDPHWTAARVPAADPVPLPSALRELDVAVAGAGRMWSLPEWLAETHGTSLVVVAGGRVVHEWYAAGLGPRTRFLGASMTKSVLTLLVGEAVRDGALTVDAAVADLVPALAGTGYAGCSVGDLLTMTTGVDWVEDHRDPDGLASRLVGCFAGAGGRSRALLAGVGARTDPGTRYEYCTADSKVLDWVRERATGAPYDVALARLWRTMGCTAEAVVGVDSDGVPMAGGSLAATARDWARVGRLQVDGTVAGTVADGRVLDRAWVDAASTPDRPFLRPGRLPSTITTHAGFGRHWWALDDGGRRVTADGSRGQFCYVDRDHDVVVVKTSRWPYDDFLVDRQLRDLSYLGLPAVASAAHQAAGATSAATGTTGATRPTEQEAP
jgi:CubicO group peptidase (beta-lactamase class C family)